MDNNAYDYDANREQYSKKPEANIRLGHNKTKKTEIMLDPKCGLYVDTSRRTHKIGALQRERKLDDSPGKGIFPLSPPLVVYSLYQSF